MDAEQLLYNEFKRRKTRDSRYSLRSFAEDVGIPAGRLTQYFSRERRITLKMAHRIAQQVSFSKAEKSLFLGLVEGKDSSVEAANSVQLSDAQFSCIANWYYFAILNLSETKGFQSQPKWIASRLGLPTQTVKDALATLVELNLLKITKEGSYVRTHEQLRTEQDIESRALKISHQQSLQQAIKKIDEVEVGFREVVSLTTSFEKDKINMVKEEIRAFVKRLNDKLQTDAGDEVYNLNVQFVPVTQLNSTQDKSKSKKTRGIK